MYADGDNLITMMVVHHYDPEAARELTSAPLGVIVQYTVRRHLCVATADLLCDITTASVRSIIISVIVIIIIIAIIIRERHDIERAR